MHSSSLRGSDFRIVRSGAVVDHSDFFASFGNSDRLGIVIADRLEGLGAITLIMAYVTAFYDRYRERGGEFLAYPDFFSFQRGEPCADYGNCDIWPQHKHVHVAADAQGTVEAINDRGVNVLLVPDIVQSRSTIEPVELESARRRIDRCYAYEESGATADADLVVECGDDSLIDWALTVIETVGDDDAGSAARAVWRQRPRGVALSQSFRELTLDGALERL